ncbi:MAG: ATP-dependent helicase HrpB, partial [bacterium]|nr:ATP-dependent helicase HrpB [bacterium]
IHRFADPGALDAFLARVAFAAKHSDLGKLSTDEVQASLKDLCRGLRSFRELTAATQKGGFLRSLRGRLSRNESRLLDEIAPERLLLPSGRRARIHYALDKPPWLASRLQDFFGMDETPRIAGGAVPLVLHLLAPNQRPVQTTTDLAGFWQRLYPQVRRELRRRYPKHQWPEKPCR